MKRASITRLTGLYKLGLLVLTITLMTAWTETLEGRLDWLELVAVLVFEVLVLGLGHFLLWHMRGRR